MRRAYLDGMERDEEIPLSFRRDGGEEEGGEALPGQQGFTVRKGVDVGMSVLDLGAMVADLEAARRRSQGGGA